MTAPTRGTSAGWTVASTATGTSTTGSRTTEESLSIAICRARIVSRWGGDGTQMNCVTPNTNEVWHLTHSAGCAGDRAGGRIFRRSLVGLSSLLSVLHIPFYFPSFLFLFHLSLFFLFSFFFLPFYFPSFRLLTSFFFFILLHVLFLYFVLSLVLFALFLSAQQACAFPAYKAIPLISASSVSGVREGTPLVNYVFMGNE